MSRADQKPAMARPTPRQASLVRGTVTQHEQHPDTRQWTLTVELRGGRLVRSVMALSPYSGLISGDRHPLPPIGSRVLIGFAEPEYGIDAFVVGCFDGYGMGLDHDSPQEAVSMSPAGLGRAVSPDGTITTLWPGGDELVAGPGAGYEFNLRDELGKPFKPSFPKRALRIIGDFTKGGLLLGARLFGGLEVMADAARRTILLKVTDRDSITIKPGLMRLQTGAVVIGEREEMAASVARWPETKATLDALKRELQDVKHELVMTNARLTRTEVQIEIVTTHPQFIFFKPVMLAVPVFPVPIYTLGGKDGALIPGVGGIEVVDAGTKTLVAE